jgi:hypothetical protein
MDVVRVIATLLHAFFLPRGALTAENLTLLQQLAVLKVSVKRCAYRKLRRH